MTNEAIRVNGLTKTYIAGKEEVKALRGVSLNVERGEFICIAGKSGSGKSTLLNLVAGLESPTDGEIDVLGQRVDLMNETERIRFRRANIGFIFQSYRLLPQYTAVENVALPLMLRGIGKKERELRAMIALDHVGIAKCANQRPSQMSGGEQQRAGIARSIITEPAIILADEPTGNLDSSTGEMILTLFQKLFRQNGTTLLIVSHDSDMPHHVDRTVYMSDGALIDKEIII